MRGEAEREGVEQEEQEQQEEEEEEQEEGEEKEKEEEEKGKRRTWYLTGSWRARERWRRLSWGPAGHQHPS